MDDLKLFDNIGKVLDHLPVKCAAIAVNFTKERFRTQNWLDKTPEPEEKAITGRYLRNPGVCAGASEEPA